MGEPSAGFGFFPEVPFLLKVDDGKSRVTPVARTMGVDIGSCSTRASMVHSKTGLSVLVADEFGRCRTPSAVYFGEDTTLVGDDAIGMLSSRTEALRVIQSFSRWVGQVDALPVLRNEVTAESVVAIILRRLAQYVTSAKAGTPITTISLSHRPHLSEKAKSALVNAAKSAGFADVCLVPDPIAAAVAIDFENDGVGDHLMVCDLGADSWTFSTVSRTEAGSFRLDLPPVVFPYGGNHIDELLYQWIVSEYRLAPSTDGRRNASLGYLCRSRKEVLSVSTSVPIDWHDSDGHSFRFEMRRDAFETLIRPMIENASVVLHEALVESTAHSGRLDSIIFVGGCARIPFVRQILEDIPGPSTRICNQPENCVALGAGYHASQSWMRDASPGTRRVRVKATTTLSDLVHRLERHEVEEKAMIDKNHQEVLASTQQRILDVYVEKSKQVDDRAVQLREWLAQSLANREYQSAQEHLSALRPIRSSDPELKRIQEFLDGHFDKVGEIRSVTMPAVPTSIAFSSQPICVIAGLSNNVVALCDMTSGTATRNICNIGGGVRAVCRIGDEDRIVTGGNDKAVKEWSFSDGKQLSSLPHGDTINEVRLVPSGIQLVSACDDRTIRMWNLESKEPVCTFEGHAGGVLSIDVNDNGTQMLSGSREPEIRLWNLETGRCLKRMTVRTGTITCVRFFPTGRLAASSGGDGCVRIWDTECGREMSRWEGHQGAINCLEFTPDGRHVVTGGEDRTVRVWDVLSGWEVRTFGGHQGPVRSLAVTPDGKQVVTGSDDKTLRLWGIGV
jgi:WD40 repeat protein